MSSQNFPTFLTVFARRPYWINYKYLKKKINDIVAERGTKADQQSVAANDIVKSSLERDFFHALRYELKKASDFFASSEQIYRIRQKRVTEGYRMLKEGNKQIDKSSWKMLLSACMKFYRDILLLENFAIMNYCGFSKILKKHDKMTGYDSSVLSLIIVDVELMQLLYKSSVYEKCDESTELHKLSVCIGMH